LKKNGLNSISYESGCLKIGWQKRLKLPAPFRQNGGLAILTRLLRGLLFHFPAAGVIGFAFV
jgi:hypothetical protein